MKKALSSSTEALSWDSKALSAPSTAV
jgi:hypothetical protein